MIEVKIIDESPMQMLGLVAELREQGCVQKRDFDFAYYPTVYDSDAGEITIRHTIFTFYDEKLASWFALKYAS